MRCPYCRHADSRVVDSREADDGQLIRRRRSCPECGKRFTTVEEAVLAVVKRSGVTEPFSRTKIIGGVRKACQGRPVDEDSIALLAQRVEETIRAKGAAEIPSHEVGLAILGPLRDLDEVAYLRFASVYRSFDSLADFEREIETLRAAARAREGAGAGTHRRAVNFFSSSDSRIARRARVDEGADEMPGDGVTTSRSRSKASAGLKIERVWTTEGVHPYDEVAWERRDVVMTNWRDGSINFEQRGVEFPESWSVNAANIVTTKYFRGAVGTPEREWSLSS